MTIGSFIRRWLSHQRPLPSIGGLEEAVISPDAEAEPASAVEPEYSEADLAVIRALFDPQFYLSANEDVALAAAEPFQHFMTHGWREGRNPSPDFDTIFYLHANPDVRQARMNPLGHFALHGQQEGRAPKPSPNQEPLIEAASPDLETEDRSSMSDIDAAHLRAVAPLFDASFYMARYPDVAEAGLDALMHYMQAGWLEGRDPSATFDTAAYLRSHPDVRESGINPLLHYALYGQHEGRALGPDPHSARLIIEQAHPSAERARAWLRPPAPCDLDVIGLVALLQDYTAPRHQPSRLIVSISHDDYIENVGGVQNIVGDEAQTLSEAGWCYLHLCPAQPLPMLAPRGAEPLGLRCRINGAYAGTITTDGLDDALAIIATRFEMRHITVHHMLGHRPEDIAAASAALRPDSSFLWIHDYFALCPSYALLRNNATYCGAPSTDSGSCMVCCFGDERLDHLARIAAFLDEVQPEICVYSEIAQLMWATKSRHQWLNVRMLQLAYLDLHSPAPTADCIRSAEAPLRVAFVGTPAHLKGWNVFASLARAHSGDSRYEFCQLSSRRVDAVNISHVPVSVGAGDRQAMVRALRTLRVDVAIIWSLWPETFCFTAYEAMAAGVFVVTSDLAGNVWPAVRSHGPRQGCCLRSEEELSAIFASGDILALASAPGRRGGDLVINAPLADHLLAIPEVVSA